MTEKPVALPSQQEVGCEHCGGSMESSGHRVPVCVICGRPRLKSKVEKSGVALPSSPACNCGAGDKMSANFHYTYCPLSKGEASTPSPLQEMVNQASALRSKFHTEHMLDKKDAVEFDRLFMQVVKAIQHSGVGVSSTPSPKSPWEHRVKLLSGTGGTTITFEPGEPGVPSTPSPTETDKASTAFERFKFDPENSPEREIAIRRTWFIQGWLDHARGVPSTPVETPINSLNERANAGLASTFWHDYCEREKVMESPVSSDWWGFRWAGYVLARYEQLCRASGSPVETQWISVEEKLPRPQQFVLACFGEDDMEVTWHTGEVWSLVHPGDPTHWMPLPSPPLAFGETSQHSTD